MSDSVLRFGTLCTERRGNNIRGTYVLQSVVHWQWNLQLEGHSSSRKSFPLTSSVWRPSLCAKASKKDSYSDLLLIWVRVLVVQVDARPQLFLLSKVEISNFSCNNSSYTSLCHVNHSADRSSKECSALVLDWCNTWYGHRPCTCKILPSFSKFTPSSLINHDCRVCQWVPDNSNAWMFKLRRWEHNLCGSHDWSLDISWIRTLQVQQRRVIPILFRSSSNPLMIIEIFFT